jgi:hypothetical protein
METDKFFFLRKIVDNIIISSPRTLDFIVYFLPSICLGVIIAFILRDEANQHDPKLRPHVQRYYGQLPQMLINNEFHSLPCQSQSQSQSNYTLLLTT